MLVADQVTQDLGNAKVVFVPGDSAAEDGDFITLKNADYEAIVADGDMSLDDLRKTVYAAGAKAIGNTPANTVGLTDRDLQGPSDFNDNLRAQ
jgi:hypothetical protein